MTAIEFHYKLISLEEDLMKFAYHLTTNKDDAKDLVQDTFLKALKYCNKFVYESNFKAWTYTIMKNTFINNYRRSVNQNTYSYHANEGFSLNYAFASSSYHADSVFAAKELVETIESLHDDFKMPFKMHHEGFKYKEIAESLNIKLGKVKRRVFIARKQLVNLVDS
jgi:RNA polymerase sigma-70 factor (ECF subfamily)